MAFQNVQTGLNPARLVLLNQLLDQVEAELAFVIKLTPEERSSLYSLGNRRVGFANKAFRFATLMPDIMPGYRNISEYKRVSFDLEAMIPLYDRIKGLNEKLMDTTMQIGANYVDFALTFYDGLKNAAQGDVPGTETMLKELATFFDRNGKIADDEEIPTTEPNLPNIPGNIQGGSNVA